MAFCSKCGTQYNDGSAFCPSCGAATQAQQAQPQQPQYGYAPQAPAKTPGTGLAVAGLVCGLISFLIFPYIFGVLGIIFGGVAKSKGARGLATAGIVLGIIGIVSWLLMIIFWKELLIAGLL